MANPFGPLVGFPQNDPQMSMMQSLMGTLQGQMGEGMPGPEMETPPGRPNPFASMGAIFAASLADQLGGRRQHLMGAQRNIAQAEEMQQMAEQRNMAREEQGRRDKMKRNLDLQLQMNELKMKMAQRVGDMQGVADAAKAEMGLLKDKHNLFKEEQDIRGQREMTLEGEKQKGRIELKGMDQQFKRESGTDGTGMTPAQQSVAQQRVRKRMDAFYGNEKNFDIKGGIRHGPAFLTGPDTPEVRVVKKEKRLRGQAAAREVIVNSVDPSEKMVALAHYLDTVRDDQGKLDLTLPGATEFDRWVQEIVADPDQWLTNLGAFD